MGFYQFKRKQKIKASVDEVWDFIATPRNLQKITPDSMGFDIQSADLPESMYEGMIIAYKVSPLLGIKMQWVTEITTVRDQEYFVDEQRVGPYAMWHHEHHIRAIEGGVLMDDIVSYRPPLGFLGSIANSLVIKSKLNEIFEYRTKALNEKFGEFLEKDAGQT